MKQGWEHEKVGPGPAENCSRTESFLFENSFVSLMVNNKQISAKESIALS